jgi:uncharacterized protein YbaR (Trm112 family)
MPPRSFPPAQFDRSTVERLACPACYGGLRIEEADSQSLRLICVACGRAYPILDGIPVLIVERAETGGA